MRGPQCGNSAGQAAGKADEDRQARARSIGHRPDEAPADDRGDILDRDGQTGQNGAEAEVAVNPVGQDRQRQADTQIGQRRAGDAEQDFAVGIGGGRPGDGMRGRRRGGGVGHARLLGRSILSGKCPAVQSPACQLHEIECAVRKRGLILKGKEEQGIPQGAGPPAPHELWTGQCLGLGWVWQPAPVQLPSATTPPVDPKPPSPRAVSPRSSTSSQVPRVTGASTSCAIRSPRRMAKLS